MRFPSSKRVVSTFLVLAIASMLGSGCSPSVGLNAGPGLVESTSNVNKAMENLSKGLNGLDPLALKALLDTYLKEKDKSTALDRLNIDLQAELAKLKNAKPFSYQVIVQADCDNMTVNVYLDEMKMENRIDNFVWPGGANQRFSDIPNNVLAVGEHVLIFTVVPCPSDYSVTGQVYQMDKNTHAYMGSPLFSAQANETTLSDHTREQEFGRYKFKVSWEPFCAK